MLAEIFEKVNLSLSSFHRQYPPEYGRWFLYRCCFSGPKAFDTVDHPLLLQKLTNIGLTTSTTQWFRSYLTNRSQITSVGDAHSASTEMPIGVPQGSILGPLLFLIYVNDLPDCHLASDIILYADDTVLYYSSKSVSDLEHHINTDLGTVSGSLEIS